MNHDSTHKFRISSDTWLEFARACKACGRTSSSILRLLIGRWLREQKVMRRQRQNSEAS